MISLGRIVLAHEGTVTLGSPTHQPASANPFLLLNGRLGKPSLPEMLGATEATDRDEHEQPHADARKGGGFRDGCDVRICRTLEG